MKAHQRLISKLIAVSLVAVMSCLTTIQAAAPVQWSELPKKIGRGKMRSDGREDCQYRVVTKNGTTYVAQGIVFSPDHVRITPAGPSVPREQVAEIRIRRDRRLSDALLAPGAAVFPSPCRGEDWCFPVGPSVLLLIPAIPLALGADAVTAPFILPIEGIRRLLPDKVIKVAP